jgi:hypothetical protein
MTLLSPLKHPPDLEEWADSGNKKIEIIFIFFFSIKMISLELQPISAKTRDKTL